MEPTVEQIEMNEMPSASYPSASSQQDNLDVSLRVKAIELAVALGANGDLKLAEEVHAFLVKKA